jgi:hypothetical protein
MADIAIAFHWPVSAMEEMFIEELSAWRERAKVRLGGEE